MLEQLRGADPFVAFVGAGASAIPPSRLPSWIGFNDLVLETLCDRLGTYSRKRQPTDAMLSALRSRRDETRFLAPDFQAQLMEEEIGVEYFKVWQSLDTSRHGPAHAALAELAVRKKLAAIITTNFDRLIEVALTERGVAFETFHDSAGYTRLASKRGDIDAPLPVIKIHGSIDDAASLVDTLRQRIAGRPAAMMQVLDELLRAHPWLFLGFSGADFSYDPRYLGVLGAAEYAKGFVFVVRDGVPVQEGVKQLASAYGVAKSEIVVGDLGSWLQQTFDISLPHSFDETADAAAVAEQRTKDGVQRWANSLEPISVVNILCAMLKASGLDAQAHWLLRKTWKSYRDSVDTVGPSYCRYNYNYGLSLLNAGFISNPVVLDEDMGNLMEWKRHADQNAFEFFGRSYKSCNLLAAGAQVAAVLAYRGDLEKAIAVGAHVVDEANQSPNKLDLCDVTIGLVPLFDIVRVIDGGIAQLARCINVATELGDEPRRAMLSAHIARFLTYSGDVHAASEFLNDAETVAERLDLQDVRLICRATRGRWLCDSGESDAEAVQLLERTLEEIQAADAEPLYTRIDLAQRDAAPDVVRSRNPILCRVLLDLNRAARFAADADTMNRTMAELGDLVESFPGYRTHYYLSAAECMIHHGGEEHRTLINDLVRLAREEGESQGNPWVAQAVNRLVAAAAE